jgi:glycosyltransferase involved in cell wall biosynthesis
VFLGAHPNVASIFRLADLAILPSSAEAMPMVILEAIAMGVPVVATDVGDVREMLERTGAGVAVPADDLEGFFQTTLGLLSRRVERDALAAAAQEAREEVDAATMVRRYEALFAAALR